MDTMSAFALGQANMGKEMMVFDWDKAAQIIRERGATYAEAGLAGDWEWTGGAILRNGKPEKESYTFLASTWATPMLELNSGESIDCYRMESEVPGWGSDTKWPKSALKILKAKK
jgi:hypothetical protein